MQQHHKCGKSEFVIELACIQKIEFGFAVAANLRFALVYQQPSEFAKGFECQHVGDVVEYLVEGLILFAR